MKYNYLSLLLLALISNLTHAAVSVIGGGLVIAPTKVIFKQGESKSQTLNLINRGDNPTTYRILSIYKKSNPDGSFTEIPAEQAENSLGNLLRFSPRQVTVLPGKTQKVRVMLRSTARLKEKEFAGRLLFRAIPDIEETTAISESEEKKAGFNLTALYGVSVPILYWPKETNISIAYKNLKHETLDNKVKINFDLIREGNKSSYQDIKLSWKNPDGQVVFLKEIKNMAVYYPQTLRKITLESDVNLINTAGQPIIELSEVKL